MCNQSCKTIKASVQSTLKNEANLPKIIFSSHQSPKSPISRSCPLVQHPGPRCHCIACYTLVSHLPVTAALYLYLSSLWSISSFCLNNTDQLLKWRKESLFNDKLVLPLISLERQLLCNQSLLEDKLLSWNSTLTRNWLWRDTSNLQTSKQWDLYNLHEQMIKEENPSNDTTIWLKWIFPIFSISPNSRVVWDSFYDHYSLSGDSSQCLP